MQRSIELEVRELTKRYSPQVSVGPISFEVHEGEFFSLLGPSGCGKTTTLRCIAGFEALSGGSIRLHGERLDAKPPHRRDVGLVFQNYALFPHLTVFDEPLSNLDFKLRLQMREELRNLQRRLGKTSIYVTHDQTEALALSDRIAVLSHGRIEQIGTPGDIYERPATAFVAEFIGSSNMLRARIVERSDERTIVATEAGLRLSCCTQASGSLDDSDV